MSKMVSLIEPCYDELEKLKEEIKEGKEACGQKTKTTYSEIICLLLKYYRNPTINLSVPSRNKAMLHELELFAEKNNFKLEFEGITNNSVKVPVWVDFRNELFARLEEEFEKEGREDIKNQNQEV